jgi:hypothetical protein
MMSIHRRGVGDNGYISRKILHSSLSFGRTNFTFAVAARLTSKENVYRARQVYDLKVMHTLFHVSVLHSASYLRHCSLVAMFAISCFHIVYLYLC